MMVDFAVSRYIRGRRDFSRGNHKKFEDYLQKRFIPQSHEEAIDYCKRELGAIEEEAKDFICKHLNLQWYEEEDIEGDWGDEEKMEKRGLTYYQPGHGERKA